MHQREEIRASLDGESSESLSQKLILVRGTARNLWFENTHRGGEGGMSVCTSGIGGVGGREGSGGAVGATSANNANGLTS